jgi:SAM-dependent methyltransferase
MTVITEPVNTPEAWSILAEAHEDPWTACGWSRDGQLDRFEAVLDELDPQAGDRFLDWGCGTGELSEYVSARVDYIGFDFAPGMVDRARHDHPGRRFQTWEPLGNFDQIACVGPFNLPDHWSKEATWHMLRRLFDRTRGTLCASLYAGDDESCLSYSLAECGRFAQGQGYSSFADQWRLNDILVVLER